MASLTVITFQWLGDVKVDGDKWIPKLFWRAQVSSLMQESCRILKLRIYFKLQDVIKICPDLVAAKYVKMCNFIHRNYE